MTRRNELYTSPGGPVMSTLHAAVSPSALALARGRAAGEAAGALPVRRAAF